MKPRLASLTSMFALLGSVSFLAAADKEPSPKVEEFLGKEAIAILSTASTVEVYRVNPADQKSPDDTKQRVGGFAVTAKGKALDKEAATKVKSILFNEATYQFDAVKKCEFSPGVAFVLKKDKEVVEVLLCLSCDELEIFTRNAEGKVIHKAHEDFDSMRAELLKLAKAGLPDDKDIQALQDKRK